MLRKDEIEVKICGLTNRDDAAAALDLGADYLGFVLYPESPRGITATAMLRILDQMDSTRKAIAVFVNESRATVEKIAEDGALHAVQLHGDEDSEAFVDMPVPVWRAVRFQAGTVSPSPEIWPVVRYVVDASVTGRYGGTGVAADWKQAAPFAEKYPVMLSGGLTPDTVANAVSTVKPLGVDVASGVETEPGKKDHAKIKAFIHGAKYTLS